MVFCWSVTRKKCSKRFFLLSIHYAHVFCIRVQLQSCGRLSSCSGVQTVVHPTFIIITRKQTLMGRKSLGTIRKMEEKSRQNYCAEQWSAERNGEFQAARSVRACSMTENVDAVRGMVPYCGLLRRKPLGTIRKMEEKSRQNYCAEQWSAERNGEFQAARSVRACSMTENVDAVRGMVPYCG